MLKKLTFLLTIVLSIVANESFSQSATFTYKIIVDNVDTEAEAKAIKADLIDIMGDAKATFDLEQKAFIVTSIHKYDLVELRDKLMLNNYPISNKIEFIE